MADKTINVDDNKGAWVSQKMHDLGDGNYAVNVYLESVPSTKVICTQFSNATFSSLVSAVNSYLASSTKKTLSISWFSGGIVSLIFYCVVNERSD